MSLNRANRITLYAVGILILLGIFAYRKVQERYASNAVEQVRQIVQEREEFKHLWFGVVVIQYPADLISYAELIWQVKPEVIVETGTNYGGLAVFLASILEKVNPNAKVITVDLDRKKWDATLATVGIPDGYNKRIIFLQGDSVSSSTVEAVRHYAEGKRGLVILDSLHTTEHVLKELNLYSKFVGLNSYMIVNDTHLDALGQGGAGKAVTEFIKTSGQFKVDPQWPGSIISCAPGGFLKRLKS